MCKMLLNILTIVTTTCWILYGSIGWLSHFVHALASVLLSVEFAFVAYFRQKMHRTTKYMNYSSDLRNGLLTRQNPLSSLKPTPPLAYQFGVALNAADLMIVMKTILILLKKLDLGKSTSYC